MVRTNQSKDRAVAIQRTGVSGGPGPVMSRCVIHNNMVYLAEGGSDKSRLLTAQVWLKDMGDYNAFNSVWNKWIDRANPPTRSCISAKMANPESLIEICITAARDA